MLNAKREPSCFAGTDIAVLPGSAMKSILGGKSPSIVDMPLLLGELNKMLHIVKRPGVWTCLALLAVAAPGWAAVVWDNGVSDKQNYGDISSFAVADDFAFTQPTTITGIRFWAFVAAGDLKTSTDFNGTVGWAFHEDEGGRPGAVVASGLDKTPGLTRDGTNSTNGYEYILGVDIATDVTLDPGAYWLQLREGEINSPFDGSRTFWSLSVNRQGASVRGDSRIDPNEQAPLNWDIEFNGDFAFRLEGSVIPEPGTLVLLGLGGLMFWRGRWGAGRND